MARKISHWMEDEIRTQIRADKRVIGMTRFFRIYPHPSVVKCCSNCPAIERVATGDFKLKCRKYNKIIDLEMFAKMLDGEFPDFCKLEETTKHNLY